MPRSGKEPAEQRPAKRTSDKVAVQVSVHLPGGKHAPKPATVTLRAAEGRSQTKLRRSKHSGLYEGEVTPGRYLLSASVGELVAPDSAVNVQAPVTVASAYVGDPTWPAYRLGDSVIPFEPRDDIVAVAFSVRAPQHEAADDLVNRITDSLPLVPYEHQGDAQRSFTAADGAIWLFTLRERRTRERVIEALRELVGPDGRVGTVVDLEPGQVKLIDNRYIVRFRDDMTPKLIDELVARTGARVLRELLPAGNARLVELPGNDPRKHAGVVDQLLQSGQVVYMEPDLVAEFTDDQFPATPPNDPAWPQANLTLQDVDNAWQYLNTNIGANSTLGAPAVYVATVDRGVQVGHPDIGGNLTDGTPQLAQCFDFNAMVACTAAGYAPDTSHGMGVYGIIAARTNNGTAIAGMAPNTHQIGLLRPLTMTTTLYADVLLWAAGFVTGNPAAGWPAEPIAPGASIISCSHGVDGLALSNFMDDTLRYISTYGRNGRGTVIVYSAGNSNQNITGFRVWAAHTRTLAISNSQQPNATGVETKDPTSNWGPQIDICAQGTNAPSLNHTGGQQIFGGTSAAAPTVAAAAALMLTAEPSLTWVEVRDLLRQTAVQIDAANTDPNGQWVGGFSQWYGFGRLDVDNAVQAADTFDLGAVNLLIRDNLADLGMTVPTGGAFWASPDIWVRSSNPAADPMPGYTVDPVGDPAVFNQDNWIRVRVKNVGSGPSSLYFVRAYLTHFAGTEFQYPTDFIPSINTGDPIPSPLTQATYLIGEQQGTGLAAGAVTIFTFVWPSALVPPETVGGTLWHPCILAEVSPHTGPVPSGNRVWDYTSIGQRNITVTYSDDDTDESTMVIGHETSRDNFRRLVVHRGCLPKRVPLWVRFPDKRVEAAVIKQFREDRCGEWGGRVVLDQRRGKRVLRLAGGSRLVLDVPMVSGPMTPVVVGADLRKCDRPGEYVVPVIEQGPKGEPLGACAVTLVVRDRKQ